MSAYKQSTAYTRTFLMVLTSDHLTGATGKTVTVNIAKAGGAFGAAAGTITEMANGWYKIALTTGDTGTLGDLTFNCTASGCDNTDFVDQISVRNLDDLAFPATSGRSMVIDAAGLVDANVVKLGPSGSGTAQTARDVGGSVLLSTGTGTGQLDFTSGVVKANLAQILGTALTETAGQIAAAFKKFFNIATPASTMDALTLVATATNLTTNNDKTGYGLGTNDSDVVDNGTAQAGAGSTITLRSGASATDNIYRGERVYITGGTGVGQSRNISGYVGSTKVATVDEAWQTNPDNTSTYVVKNSRGAKVNASGQIVGVSLADTVTTYTGNTPQTGDAFARLGAPAGASVSADILAAKGDTAAIKVQTDKLTFTVANQVDSNVLDWKSATAPAMTGDAFARLGAPAGASVSADMAAVKGDTAAIKTDVESTGVVVAAASKTGYGLAASDSDLADNGTAQAGAAGTLTLRSGASATDNLYRGLRLFLTSGTGAGQSRLITGYVGSTKVATVDENWVTTPDNTTTYAVKSHRGAKINSSGQVIGVALVDTLTTYTNDTPQSGDAFSRIGSTGAGLTTLAQDSTVAKASAVAALNNISQAQVLNQVNAALDAANTEVTSVPASTASLRSMISYVFAWRRNKKLQTSTTMKLRNDGDSADIASSTVSDDGTTLTMGKDA